jgi:hypothetical protein
MQNGIFCAAAGNALTIEAAQHTVSATIAFRIAFSVLGLKHSRRVCQQKGPIDPSQFTFARCALTPPGSLYDQ